MSRSDIIFPRHSNLIQLIPGDCHSNQDQKMMKNYSSAGRITILGALAVTLLIGACDKKEAVGEAPMRSVRYVEVEAGNTEKARSFGGVAKSEQEANLSFKVTGTLITFDIAVGDVLEAGQLIAEIEPSEYQLQAQQAQADLTRAIAEQRNAASTYQRTRELYENQNASKTDLDTSRAASESAEALVSVSERALEISQLNVSYTRLTATESCSVASTSVEVGENVSIGQEILRVNCGDEIKVEVSVPENLISLVTPGLSTSITFDSIPGKIYEGKVTEIGVSATSTTFPVSVRLTESDSLRTGLAAQVRFNLPVDEVKFVVPVSAVAEDDEGRYVYIVILDDSGHSGVIKRAAVEVGNIVSNGIEIASGINLGDRVVTAGVTVIRDGLEVLVN